MGFLYFLIDLSPFIQEASSVPQLRGCWQDLLFRSSMSARRRQKNLSAKKAPVCVFASKKKYQKIVLFKRSPSISIEDQKKSSSQWVKNKQRSGEQKSSGKLPPKFCQLEHKSLLPCLQCPRYLNAHRPLHLSRLGMTPYVVHKMLTTGFYFHFGMHNLTNLQSCSTHRDFLGQALPVPAPSRMRAGASGWNSIQEVMLTCSEVGFRR